MLPSAFSQAAANRFSWPSSDWTAAAPTGTGSGRSVAVVDVPLGELPQVTGSLRWTPRGSKDTTSKSSSTVAVITDSSLARSLMPDTPGPPGLTTSDPIRWAGASAG